MDLSPAGTYLYLLMVVTLYASPLVIIALFVARRKCRTVQVVKGTVIGIPVLAALLQAGFYLDILSLAFRLESDRAFYDKTFPAEVSFYRGRVVGYKTSGGFTYTRYQFEVDPLLPDVVEITMPPANVTSAAIVRLTSPSPGLPETAGAQLVVRNAGSYYGVGDAAPKDYFRKHYPEILAYITEDPLLLLSLSPGGRSSVSKYDGPDAKRPWNHQMARVDF